jgi:predicted metal-dependent hydrolase
VSIRTQGRFYDLRDIFDDLNSEYFGGRISATISWSRQTSRRHARKRLLGSYWSQTNAIRINPVLDRKSVPLYVIRYIVYHEMLHSVVKEERRNGRRRVHTPAFRKQEQLFKDHDKAVAWEKRNR